MLIENKYKVKDEELFAEVQKLKDGVGGDYNRLYELSEKYIYKIINDIVKNHHTTEDLMQETYLQIYNKIGTIQEANAFYVWAGRIATNLTLRYVQKYRKEVLATADEEGNIDFVFDVATEDNECFIPENVLMDKEKQRLIAEIIDNLSVEQKLSVQYFYYEEMSVRDIAQAMECSEGTVKSRLNYARKSIKDAVIELDEKKGTKLYSLGAFPLFWLLFRESVEAAALAETAGASAGAAVAAEAGKTSAAAATGSVAAGTAAAKGSAVAGSVASKFLGTTAGKAVICVVIVIIIVYSGVALVNGGNESKTQNDIVVEDSNFQQEDLIEEGMEQEEPQQPVVVPESTATPQPTETPVPTEEPQEQLTEEQKEELELKQQLEEGIDQVASSIEERILSYYEAIQNDPMENGSEYLMSDIYVDVCLLNALIEEYDMHYYIDDRFSISGYEDEEGYTYVSYIFEPEGCEDNNRMGFYYTDNSFLGGGGRGRATRLGDAQWRYGVYYGAYDGDVRSGQGTLYGYTHSAYKSGSLYTYSGEWANDVPNGSGNWDLQIHAYNDKIEWYKESATVTAEAGRLTGSFNVDICDENGKTVKGIYNVENGRYVAVGTNTYVLEKQLKKKMGADDYAYCICYNDEAHGSLVLWRQYDEREPGDHWIFKCSYDNDFDN